ncbi:PepSY domain-containing protein [Pseudalkalibacillus decolorationis]|uniref:PepSY domain-containing protein n=1 Tax=Pseudalkalibacillus decolorationis TaxID=163879 RepID=UPI0021495002|nr:PepSY domain-containing protein [Pseudalkalibacillus decolorationis]
MKRNSLIIFGVALFVVGIIIGAQEILASKNDQPLSKKDLKEFITSKYSGQIKEITAKNEEKYEVLLDRESGSYKIVVNAEKRSIESLKAIKINKKWIDEEKAKEIALKEVKGEVDNVKLANKENPPAYKISVKTDSGVTIVSIHAESGEIVDKSEQPQPKEPKKTLISEEEAKQKALVKVNKGEVDDIEIITINGIPVYEIELEINDDLEATVLVDGFTGETTITYED